jgi:hypothetical protein
LNLDSPFGLTKLLVEPFIVSLQPLEFFVPGVPGAFTAAFVILESRQGSDLVLHYTCFDEIAEMGGSLKAAGLGDGFDNSQATPSPSFA